MTREEFNNMKSSDLLYHLQVKVPGVRELEDYALDILEEMIKGKEVLVRYDDVIYSGEVRYVRKMTKAQLIKKLGPTPHLATRRTRIDGNEPLVIVRVEFAPNEKVWAVFDENEKPEDGTDVYIPVVHGMKFGVVTMAMRDIVKSGGSLPIAYRYK